jgi:ABC-type transport system involved in multi-copper enzyme maturation permease subunit
MTTTTAAADPRPLPPPVASLPAALIIAGYAFREMARRRRLLSLGLLMFVPVVLLLTVRMLHDGVLDPEVMLALLLGDVLIPFLIPVVAMAVGASAIGEPVEDGTLVYYWTRPIRRHALYIGRMGAAQLVAAGLVILSLALCFATLAFGGFGAVTWSFVKLYLAAALVALLGTAVYTSLFACLGTGLKRPLLASLLFVFGWEPLVSGIPQRIQEWTVRFHLRNLVTWPDTPTTGLRGILEELLNRAMTRPAVPDWRSVLVLLVVMVVATVIGIFLLGRRELDRQGG